jgi:hypothetical protein
MRAIGQLKVLFCPLSGICLASAWIYLRMDDATLDVFLAFLCLWMDDATLDVFLAFLYLWMDDATLDVFLAFLYLWMDDATLDALSTFDHLSIIYLPFTIHLSFLYL